MHAASTPVSSASTPRGHSVRPPGSIWPTWTPSRVSVERARREYDALLAENFGDTSARFSRALLELRQGQAERAYIDLSTLLERTVKPKNRRRRAGGARAMALLLLGRPAEAIADATRAQQLQPGPGSRAAPAANHSGRAPARPFAARPARSSWRLLPLGGRRLAADLQAAAMASTSCRDPPRRDLPGVPHSGGDPGGAGPTGAAVAAATRHSRSHHIRPEAI